MSDSVFALPYQSAWPAARIVGDGLAWLGGGVLFAATVFFLVALPGLLD